MLKKEFQQKDVARMRNLITGQVTAKTGIQSGYEKQSEEHIEGDIWEENGKKWTIKNGIKQTVTKLDAIKKMVVMPLACPKCSQAMKLTDLNRKMYAIHGMCFDCVIKMETELKAKGLYAEYERRMMNQNKDSYLVDLEQALDDWMQETSNFISENGEVEDWSGGYKDKDEYKALKEAIQKGKETEI